MSIKQSLCYPLYKPAQMGFDEFCALAAEIGFAAIELWGRGDDFDQLVRAAHKHRLVVASMCGHNSLPKGLNNRHDHDRIEKELRESIDIAAANGIPGLICFSGNRLPNLDDVAAIDATADGFKRVAEHAEARGVNLNIELLNSKVDHPGYQCDRTWWAAAVCEKVGSPRVKMLYDIYHMQIMEGDIIRTIREHVKWVGHFHTAGNPGRNDMNDTQELNYAGICQAIAATGYDLYVGHEFKPLGDPIQAMRDAFELCNVAAPAGV